MGVTEEMNSAEIMKNAMDAFKNLQEYMLPYRKTSRICRTLRRFCSFFKITGSYAAGKAPVPGPVRPSAPVQMPFLLRQTSAQSQKLPRTGG